MKIQYYKNSGKAPDSSFVGTWSKHFQGLVDVLQPQCPDHIDKDADRSICERFCEQFKACEAHSELRGFFRSPFVVCMCNNADGRSDPKTGHREGCYYGEAGRKQRRRIEDRLRKDIELMRLVGRIIGTD